MRLIRLFIDRRTHSQIADLEAQVEHWQRAAHGWWNALERLQGDMQNVLADITYHAGVCEREASHMRRRIKEGGPRPRGEYERELVIHESHGRLMRRWATPGEWHRRDPATGLWTRRATSAGQFDRLRRDRNKLKGVRREN